MHYDYLLFIGRFQPFHHGHRVMVQRALQHGKKLILLCGSANMPRSCRNPWLFSERETMIRSSLTAAENARLIIAPLADNPYNDQAWTESVAALVGEILQADNAPAKSKTALFGYVKDRSSFYLKLFPQWDFIAADNVDGISATPLRTRYFMLPPEAQYDEAQQPEAVNQYLRHFKTTDAYQQVAAETRYVQAYKASWQAAPYPPVFVTTDALVLCTGHILLVERGGQPGYGLWAMPGGFLNPEESLAAGCLRELAEETGLTLQPTEIRHVRTVDKPDRSAIGRVITHLHSFILQGKTLPEVSAADDAARAFWLPVSELRPERCHDDHYFLIRDTLTLFMQHHR